MKTASDIMTHGVKMIASSDSLEAVVKLFLEQGITASPVMNPLGEVLGIVSELNLIKAYMIYKSKNPKNEKIGHHAELFEPMSIIMLDTPIIDVFKEMIAAPTHRLLVKNKDKFVGFISPKDLMRAMIGQANPSVNLKDKLKETEFLLKKSLETLKNTEHQLEIYEQAFQETPYMMHAVNKDGKIIMANRREHDTLGYEDNELVGKTIFDLYSKTMHADAAAGLKKVMDSGFHHVTYTTLLKKDGSPLRCDIASAAIFDDHHNFVSTISVLRPVDSDEMLRALNGIVNDASGPLGRYAKISE